MSEVGEDVVMELVQPLKDRAGAGMVDKALAETGPLLDADGLSAFLRVAGMFMAFDLSITQGFLRNGPSLLARMDGERARGDVLRAIAGMERRRWTVASAALDAIGGMMDIAPGFVARWLERGAELGRIDQDAAVRYFESSGEVFGHLGKDKFETWSRLGLEIAEKSWKAAKEYFRSSAEVVRKIEPTDLERWARLGLLLIEKSPTIKKAESAQSMFAQGAAAGKNKKLDLAIQYFKSAPQILGRIAISDLDDWVETGLQASGAGEDKGGSFFSLRSGKSRKAVDSLVRGLELKDIHTVLRGYVKALTGTEVNLKSSSIFYRDFPGLSRFYTVSDGTRIFLPSQIGVFGDEEANFKTYKMALTHELAHIRLGTFDLRAEDVAGLYAYHDQVLPFKIFEFLEDERVDNWLYGQYPGLAKDRRWLLEAYLKHKGLNADGLSVFEAQSFRDIGMAPAPEVAGDRLTGLLEEALDKVREPGRTAKDSLELAVALYEKYLAVEADGGGTDRVTPDRLFYRGIIDFELVAKSRAGTARLMGDLRDRFEARKIGVAPGSVEEALERIEASEGLECERLPWQIETSDGVADLFEEVNLVVQEIEMEKRIRRTAYYDEWDHKLGDYNKNWCKVREMDMLPTSRAFYDDTIQDYYGIVSQLRRHFSLIRPDRIKRYFREERGDDIDFDALVESMVDRHAGITPSDRVYIRREKNLRDVSVAFLVDMSYSTSDELPSGKTIMDVQREGLVLMAEALESIGDQWAVYGFSTSRREKVDFFVVRDFDMPFSDDVKMRFASLKPMQQTRLGAVVRHATSLLNRMSSRIRLLVLLSDGRPYDVDYGDASYAVEDTRRALWEGRRKGITYYCITVDKKSRSYLPHMYGETNYSVIDDIEALPVMLPLIYKRLTT